MKGIQLRKKINNVLEDVAPYTEAGLVLGLQDEITKMGYATQVFVAESIEEAEQIAIQAAKAYTDSYFTPKEVFNGGVYLLDSHSYSWDWDVADLKSCVIVICTRYSPGEGMLDYGYGVYVFPKAAIEAFPGKSLWEGMKGSSDFAKKTFYMTPTTIKGHDDNGVAPNNNFVICKIIVV
ncbi:hypothetical protein X560_0372 [Listeria fleischmannii 1991]|uniref:Uncharacterized protein n=2 Tax=Listeria fleischmannii TaxID=1069827 RepID=A0A2X3HDH3_9LIST|nr:hypothetical protein [Listeria fleischmannii]EMG27084.1 hypothetical protein LFLEISCH_13055 [Listeria fleischmannii subsp. fleischmannii LU2006-1]KMT60952.1 hypothetical protein X560_0372 [Listeria fleischmannii 1991]SQC70607.1 Uncharacterised protein [Listeria fleischmannii subsp. fleischmannii]